jgi:hypothetical protein
MASVVPMRFAQGRSQAVFGVRHHHQVHVIGHQAMGPDFGFSLACGFGYQGDVMAIIAFGEKSPLAAIPALGDVMGITWYDETWHSGHYLPPCKLFNGDEDITRCRSIDER